MEELVTHQFSSKNIEWDRIHMHGVVGFGRINQYERITLPNPQIIERYPGTRGLLYHDVQGSCQKFRKSGVSVFPSVYIEAGGLVS